MLNKLIYLYGEEKGREAEERLKSIIKEAKSNTISEDRQLWDEKDIFLITYPDSFYEKKSPTLQILNKLLLYHLRGGTNGGISGVHILPFYPYSSDRGFSITDYYQVKKEFGTWQDVENIAKNYRLMADLVLNHVSVKHAWFQKFLAGDPKYEDYFIWFKKDKIPHEELKKVDRPRATPLLTPYKTIKGERWIWTTFSVENSTDQVDLNYKNPEILLEIVRIILFLLQKGVRIFRLDAIPYIWKKLGTSCENLPEAHVVVSLLRNVLDLVCTTALLISQSSVPFEENLVYFGQESKESNILYNFALPPLVLQAFYSQSNKHLNELAEKMKVPDSDSAFFNILAVHDGIGVTGAKGFLSEQEFKIVYQKIEERGGKLSYFRQPDGNKSVRELNITWWSALNSIEAEPFDLQLKKFITSHAIAFSLVGIPAVYYLSLFGGQNDLSLFAQTKIKRDINRTNLDLRSLNFRLKNKDAKEAKVFAATINLIKKRKSLKAFHPNARQEVLFSDERVFALLRGEKDKQILALHNLSDAKVKVQYQGKTYLLEPYSFIWQEL